MFRASATYTSSYYLIGGFTHLGHTKTANGTGGNGPRGQQLPLVNAQPSEGQSFTELRRHHPNPTPLPWPLSLESTAWPPAHRNGQPPPAGWLTRPPTPAYPPRVAVPMVVVVEMLELQ